MLNIGTGEIIFIAVAALLILGPTKLPEFARTIGKLVRDFRRQTDDVRNVVEREFYKMDQQLQEPPPPLPQAAPDAIAHGDDHAGELPAETQGQLALSAPGSDALPSADADVSQVMKGAPTGEPVSVAPVVEPAPASEAVPAPEKASS